MSQGLIFDLKRYAIHDGPGIRLTVFFKGCPLHCLWCHNPESIAPQVQKLFSAGKCIGCGECGRVCPAQACAQTTAGIVTDPDRCTCCGQCAEVCPTRATEMSGRSVSVAELVQVLEKERPFFEQSGGGVTFSGGEPLLYPDFLCALLEACGEKGIHRVVDTSGQASREVLLRVAERTDLFLYDLKLFDSARHQRWTGRGNEAILANLQALAATNALIQIRIPLIGGVNTDVANLESIAVFVAGLSGSKKTINLLPFHDVARGKDDKLGQHRDLGDLRVPTVAELEQATAVFARHGLDVSMGG